MCREKADKAEAKWRAAAEADWRKLLSTVLARLRVANEHALQAPGSGAGAGGCTGSAEQPISLDSNEEAGRGAGRGSKVKVEEI